MQVSNAHRLLAIFFFRLLLNTGRRFIYPFAPALARELSLPLGAVTSIIAATQCTSILGLFSGPIADRIGNRFMMRVGLGLLAVGMLICGLVPQYWFIFTGLVLAGFGKTVFDPAIQSFIGHTVPFEKRGRIIGIIETSWAGATLFSIPALGLLISHSGFQTSFITLALLASCCWLYVGFVIPHTTETTGTYREKAKVSIATALLETLRYRPTAAMMAFGFWISLGNDALFVVYGFWFEKEFAVSLVTLGFTTVAIGSAELLGETLTSLFSDRIGLRNFLLLALSLVVISYLLLPVLGFALLPAMLGIFLVFLFFETAMVTSFGLSTELMPQARATMMAGFYAAGGIGRVLGVILGGLGWKLGGIKLVAGGAAFATITGLLFFLWGFQKIKTEKGDQDLSV